MLHPREHYMPRTRLSKQGNMEEFMLPDNPMGELVACGDLVWACIAGSAQPMIYNPKLTYPPHFSATLSQIEAYRVWRANQKKKHYE